jgi:hypothetical protein
MFQVCSINTFLVMVCSFCRINDEGSLVRVVGLSVSTPSSSSNVLWCCVFSCIILMCFFIFSPLCSCVVQALFGCIKI